MSMVDWRVPFLRCLGFVDPPSHEAFGRLNELNWTPKTFLPESKITNETGMWAIVASGWAYRYRVLADGRRIVFDIGLPGNLIDLAPRLVESGITVAACNRLDVAVMHHSQIRTLCATSQSLREAIAIDEQRSTLRLMNHVMRLSRLTAYERISHFLLEIYDRLHAVGLAAGERFEFPLGQTILADALGITNVHVSRTLKRLRTDGWIELNNHTVRLRDFSSLAELCEYERLSPGDHQGWSS